MTPMEALTLGYLAGTFFTVVVAAVAIIIYRDGRK
jgi:hypothetical protein